MWLFVHSFLTQTQGKLLVVPWHSSSVLTPESASSGLELSTSGWAACAQGDQWGWDEVAPTPAVKYTRHCEWAPNWGDWQKG